MPGTNLTATEAHDRAVVVHDVERYEIALDLMRGEQTFGVREKVTFTAEPGARTFIDFIGPEVTSIRLNGRDLDPGEHFADSRISLPDLAADNVLEVEATAAYMNTGEGLHRFTDPADGEVYLYTQFETADARRVFPVFEQPDLKSRFQFTVTAPAHWQLISNEPTPEPTPAGEGAATWAFAPSARMSSYIAALIAGPYEVVRSEIPSRKGMVPAGVYCRKSLRQYLDAEEFFEVTAQGFAFYEELFDQEYPFTKYDQIMAPEYNAGAMENAGAVTFHEMCIFRGPVPESRREWRAVVILHELAHMWFGNLVTMKWWSDLWLNESFADWAAATAQAEATRWAGSWVSFATQDKAHAYRADQLSTTHPIVATIANLLDAETNFDGITYSKGASVLKQMVAYVGREAFTEGLRAYFRKHKWGNTTLDDLLSELSAASGRDMGEWSKLWLQTAGVNTLRAELETDDEGIITSAKVVQSAIEAQPTLRPHRIVVGGYDLRDGVLERTVRIEMDVEAAQSTPIPELVGKPRPDLLLLNDEDLSYAKIRLDEFSRATLAENPEALTDPMAQALVMAGLWDMTRDGEMPAAEYVPMALRALTDELDSTVVGTFLRNMETAATVYTSADKRPGAVADLVGGLRAVLTSAAPGGDLQLQVVRSLANLVVADEDVAWLTGIFDGSTSLAGLTLDQDLRWHLLIGLARAGAADESMIDAEAEADKTIDGAESAAQARAARPGTDAKMAAFERAFRADDVSNSMLASMGVGWRQVREAEDLRPVVDRYFAEIRSRVEEVLSAGGGLAMAQPLGVHLYPRALADQALLDATNAWLAANADAPTPLVRQMSENRDEVERMVRAQRA